MEKLAAQSATAIEAGNEANLPRGTLSGHEELDTI